MSGPTVAASGYACMMTLAHASETARAMSSINTCGIACAAAEGEDGVAEARHLDRCGRHSAAHVDRCRAAGAHARGASLRVGGSAAKRTQAPGGRTAAATVDAH